jgi:Mrp family chromosome partitioning ATPase
VIYVCNFSVLSVCFPWVGAATRKDSMNAVEAVVKAFGNNRWVHDQRTMCTPTSLVTCIQLRDTLLVAYWEHLLGRRMKIHWWASCNEISQHQFTFTACFSHMQGLPRRPGPAPQIPRKIGPIQKRSIPNVKKVLAIASGKGGVGKSTVAGEHMHAWWTL